ncbi:MAG: TIGR04283 family arsenosugar biosynthesis glycosyltransferase [Gammaproteobacteria bacterium]|nr:TIGR04283 family arsenosugar biosynthesis glycosyltransferase [Gammaproteobacteria bacterium]
MIIPVLNEADLLSQQLQSLQSWRLAGHEIVVVDGGSQGSMESGHRKLTDKILQSRKGRSLQMNAGAQAADGDILLFLHVDTRLPEDALALIEDAMSDISTVWGRFDVRLSGRAAIFRIIERAISVRSHLTGVVTGDQGLFVRRRVFEQVQGFAPVPLMEDVEISKRLKRLAWPVRITRPVITSSRRWEQHGAIRTVLLMWWLRLQYFLGTSPEKLANKYYK